MINEFKTSGDTLQNSFNQILQQTLQLNEAIKPVSDNLNKVTIMGSKLGALVTIQDQLNALIQLSLKAGAQREEVEVLRQKSKEAGVQIKFLREELVKLSPDALKRIGVSTELLNNSQSLILRELKKNNKDFKQLKETNVTITALAKGADLLKDGLKTIAGSVTGALGIGGGIGSAVDMLHTAYRRAKDIGKLTQVTGINIGTIGTFSRRAFSAQLFTKTRENITLFREEYALMYDESMQVMQTVSAVGMGRPVPEEALNQITKYVAASKKFLNASEQASVPLVRDEYSRFNMTSSQVGDLILRVASQAQMMGMSFDSYTQLIRGISRNYHDYGISLLTVSEGLLKIYHSDILKNMGFKSSVSQSERILQLQLDIKTLNTQNPNTIAEVASRIGGLQKLPITKAMQQLKIGTSSAGAYGDQWRDLSEKAITSVVNDLPDKNFKSIKEIFSLMGFSITDEMAVIIVDGYATGVIKDRILSDLIGNNTPEQQRVTEIGKETWKSAEPLFAKIKNTLFKIAVDDLQLFQERFMDAAIDQAQTVETYLESVGNKFPNVIKMAQQLAEQFGAYLPILTAALAGVIGFVISVIAPLGFGLLKKIRSLFPKVLIPMLEDVKPLTLMEKLGGASKSLLKMGGRAAIIGGVAASLWHLMGLGQQSQAQPDMFHGPQQSQTITEQQVRARTEKQIAERLKTTPNISLTKEQLDRYGLKELPPQAFARQNQNLRLDFDDNNSQSRDSLLHGFVEDAFGELAQGVDIFEKYGLDEVLTKEEQTLVKQSSLTADGVQTVVTKVLKNNLKAQTLALGVQLKKSRQDLENTTNHTRNFFDHLLHVDRSIGTSINKIDSLKLEELWTQASKGMGGQNITSYLAGELESKWIDIIKRANPRQADDIIKGLIQYSKESSVPVNLLAAQMQAESGFAFQGSNHVGAMGLAQFMPGTWKTWGEGDPNNALNSTKAQAKYMRYIYDYLSKRAKEFGLDISEVELWKFAAAGYNAGPGNAERWLRALKGQQQQATFDQVLEKHLVYRETSNYVTNIMKNATLAPQATNANIPNKTSPTPIAPTHTTYHVRDTQEALDVLSKEGIR